MSCKVDVAPPTKKKSNGGFAKPKRKVNLSFLRKLQQQKAAKATKVQMYMNVKLDGKGELFRFEIKLTNSIGGLRKYIGRRYSCSPFQIELIANSRVLLNHQTVGQSGLGENAILECNILECKDEQAEKEKGQALDAMTCISHGLRAIQQNALIQFDLKDLTKEGCVSFYKMSLPTPVQVCDLKNYIAHQLGKRVEDIELSCLDKKMVDGEVSEFVLDETTVVCTNAEPKI